MKTISLLALSCALSLLVACSSAEGPGSRPPAGVALLPLDWSVDQSGQRASALLHGLLLTNSARYVTGEPDTKVIAAVDPKIHRVAWTAHV